VPFSAALLPEVQDFDCGTTNPWETEVSDWIKEPSLDRDGAIADMTNRGTEVWLFRLNSAQGPIVGFASLGESNWPLNPSPAPRTKINIIPNMAVQKVYWGQSDDNGKFSDQILDFIKFGAEGHTERQRLIGLYVHPQNDGAIRLYNHHKYEFVPGRFCPVNGVKYPAMLVEF
jgi:hypothetical protein